MRELNLAQVLAIPAVLSGEIEINLGGGVLRGPIDSAALTSAGTNFLLKWCALMDDNEEWHWIEFPQIDIDKKTRFMQIDYGIILLISPEILAGVIYPKGTGRLDPKIVHGMKHHRKRCERLA